MTKLGFPFLAALLGLSAFAGCLGDSDASTELAPPGGYAAVPASTEIVWNTSDYRGDFAVRFQLSSRSPNECRIYFNATGIIETPGPAFFYQTQDVSGVIETRIGAGQRSFEGYARAHAGPAADETVNSPASPYFPHRWSESNLGRTHELGPGEGWLNVTLAARSLAPPDDATPSYIHERVGDNSAHLSISCQGPLEIADIEGSQEAFFFNEASFEGGVGVHADLVGDPSGAAVADRFAREISSDSGVMVVDFGGDLLLLRAGGGVITVTYPGGEDTIVALPGNVLVIGAVDPPPWERTYSAGAGTYQAEISYTSVEFLALLMGAILGFEAIGALDDVLLAV